MRLDPGLYCIFHHAGERADAPGAEPSAIRVSLPPGAQDARCGVEICGFSAGGWIARDRDAALIRVTDHPSEILVSIYHSPGSESRPPRIEIVRLGGPSGSRIQGAPSAPLSERLAADPKNGIASGVLAHVQGTGDVRAAFGTWIGTRGSRRWIEGVEIDPPVGLACGEISYQAVLGHDWVSPWARGGEFCGSRHRALPILGLTLQLGDQARARLECAILASFVDGSMAGPLAPGERCVAASLAPLEALQVILRPRRVRISTAAPSRRAAVHAVPANAPKGGRRPKRDPRTRVATPKE